MSSAEWREYETEQHGTDYAAAYVLAASQRDALRERLRDTAAALEDLQSAIEYYDTSESRAILSRLKKEGLV